MARKTAPRANRRARQASTKESDDGLLDVTVVLLEDGYSSTAIAPIEIFHSAGVVWNWLHGEAVRPRFRVRTASIDGRKVSAAGSLGLIPDCAINDDQADRHHHCLCARLGRVGRHCKKHSARTLAAKMARARRLHRWHVHRCCIPCGKRNSRWPTGNHPLGRR